MLIEKKEGHLLYAEIFEKYSEQIVLNYVIDFLLQFFPWTILSARTN